MSSCRLCSKNVSIMCRCDICPECIVWKGHKDCIEAIRNKEETEKEMKKRGGKNGNKE
jgi:hypothetical protein